MEGKTLITNKVLYGLKSSGASFRAFLSARLDYVALEFISNQLEKRGIRLPSRVSNPMAAGYVPELDNSPELKSDDITHFQELNGILRWAVEIGRIDILTELSMLSAFQARYTTFLHI